MYGAVQRHQITSDVEKFGGADLKSQCDPDPVFTSKSALYGHREIRISPYKTTAYSQDGLGLRSVGKAEFRSSEGQIDVYVRALVCVVIDVIFDFAVPLQTLHFLYESSHL